MDYYLHPPFFIIEPQVSFDDAWEDFCCELLNFDNETNLIRRRMPPDLGADLIWDEEEIIYQCKAVYYGGSGALDLNKVKQSIDRAVENQSLLGWKRYVLCTNVNLTGSQESKLKEYLPCIEFRTATYWISLCKKFSQSISHRFRFLSDASALASKLWHVPYHRNSSYFTGREDVLAVIYAGWHDTSEAVINRFRALYGLGGIGKTQIALEYAYRYREVYSAIFWINAGSKETMTADFLKIAEMLHLSRENFYESSNSQQQIIALVKNWLAQNKDWLIILDNINDMKAVFDFLPTEENGYVLLTTRDRYVEYVASGLEVEGLEKEDGRLLLQKRAKLISQEDTFSGEVSADVQLIDLLVTLMEGLPLALDQAGAYILETKCGLSHYYYLYQTRKADLLRKRSNISNSYLESVITTWSISFREIEEKNPIAAEILRFCAFLNPDFIPEEMIIDVFKRIYILFEKWSQAEKRDEPEDDIWLAAALSKNERYRGINVFSYYPKDLYGSFTIEENFLLVDNVIKDLLRFSILKRHNDMNTFSIHRLVQVAIIEEIPEERRLFWATIVFQTLNFRLPYRALPETWKQCQRYLSQINACLKMLDEFYDLFIHFKYLARQTFGYLNIMGEYLHEQENYEQARFLFEIALELCENVQEPDNFDIAILWHQLARLSFEEGKYDEAEALFHRAIDLHNQRPIIKKEEMYSALMSFHELARLSIAQKKFSKAFHLINFTLQMKTDLLGENHRDTAATMHELAFLYKHQRRFEEAAPLLEKVLTIEQKVLGEKHFDVAITLNNLGETYFFLKRLQEAANCFDQSLDIFIATETIYHSAASTPIIYLAKIYEQQGDRELSVMYYEQYYRLYLSTKNDASDSLNKINLLDNIVDVYLELSLWARAEKNVLELLNVLENSSGVMQERYFKTLYDLAKIYYVQKKNKEALSIYQRANALVSSIDFQDRYTLAIFFSDFARLYIVNDQPEQALPLSSKAMEIIRLEGLDHPDLKYVVELHQWLQHNLQLHKETSKNPISRKKRKPRKRK